MKKAILIGCIISLCYSEAISQTFVNYRKERNIERKNDLMLSPFQLLALDLNFYYERLLNENSGLGIQVEKSFDKNRSQISPYYRFYFGKNYASGFFVEGYLPITTASSNSFLGIQKYFSNNDDTETTVGFGFGLGGKWAMKKNVLLEISGGVGRNSNRFIDSGVTAKGMLGVGYRF